MAQYLYINNYIYKEVRANKLYEMKFLKRKKTIKFGHKSNCYIYLWSKNLFYVISFPGFSKDSSISQTFSRYLHEIILSTNIKHNLTNFNYYSNNFVLSLQYVLA